ALDDATQIAVWRIVQEAATNTVRHARATRFRACLRVGVRETCALAILDLRDDGVGLPSAADHTQGFGLQGMRDRVLALSGAMRTTSNAHGTRLHVLLRQAV
ncbi:MAG: ATP-binding protein, partial [Steroidobacteraceae bacterium]